MLENQNTKRIDEIIQTQIPFSLKIDDPCIIQIPITSDISFCIISTEVIEIPPPSSKTKKNYYFCCF